MIKAKTLKPADSVNNEFDAVLMTALQSINRLTVALTEKSLNEIKDGRTTTKECIDNVYGVASRIKNLVTIASLIRYEKN